VCRLPGFGAVMAVTVCHEADGYQGDKASGTAHRPPFISRADPEICRARAISPASAGFFLCPERHTENSPVSNQAVFFVLGITLLAGVAVGYGVREFISYRRRTAARRKATKRRREQAKRLGFKE
jgi:hypothetical protein